MLFVSHSIIPNTIGYSVLLKILCSCLIQKKTPSVKRSYCNPTIIKCTVQLCLDLNEVSVILINLNAEDVPQVIEMK